MTKTSASLSLALLCALIMGAAHARPQEIEGRHYGGGAGGGGSFGGGGGGVHGGGGGGGHGGGGVHTGGQCKTIYFLDHVEKVEKVCSDRIVKHCVNDPQRHCEPYYENVCRQVSQPHCENQRKKECQTAYKVVSKPYQEDKCEETISRECDKIWKYDDNGKQYYVEDPHSCRDIRETRCEKVTKHREERVPYQDCQWRDHKHCYDVTKQECSKVKREKCSWKNREHCTNQHKKECKDVHRTIPVQREKTVCRGDADYDEYDDYGDGDYIVDGRRTEKDGPYTAEDVDDAVRDHRDESGGSEFGNGGGGGGGRGGGDRDRGREEATTPRTGESGSRNPAGRSNGDEFGDDSRVHFGDGGDGGGGGGTNAATQRPLGPGVRAAEGAAGGDGGGDGSDDAVHFSR